MTKDDALTYCHARRRQFLRDCYAGGNDDGHEQFDCLIAIVEHGTIQPEALTEYGMDYPQTDEDDEALRREPAQPAEGKP